MSAPNYVRHVFLKYLLRTDFDEKFSTNWVPEELARDIFSESLQDSIHEMGFVSNDPMIDLRNEVINDLLNSSALRVEGDEYTGVYYKLNVALKDRYIQQFFVADSVSATILKLGADALDRALSKVAEELGWRRRSDLPDHIPEIYMLPELGSPRLNEFKIPASDRVVSISHNQQREMIDAIEEVREALQEENSFDGDVTVRERFVAQFSAGRELILSTSVRAYLIYETLVRMLGHVIEKYRDKALGVAAARLLELLIENFFED